MWSSYFRWTRTKIFHQLRHDQLPLKQRYRYGRYEQWLRFRTYANTVLFWSSGVNLITLIYCLGWFCKLKNCCRNGSRSDSCTHWGSLLRDSFISPMWLPAYLVILQYEQAPLQCAPSIFCRSSIGHSASFHSFFSVKLLGYPFTANPFRVDNHCC